MYQQDQLLTSFTSLSRKNFSLSSFIYFCFEFYIRLRFVPIHYVNYLKMHPNE